MNIKTLLILLTFFALSSCDVRQSVNKDLVTGLTTRGDGLSCDDVYLSIDDEQIVRNSFIYGETFYLNFSNIEGFNKIDDKVFPGMLLYVINESGDTIMQTGDMYADYVDGISLSPLLLKANLTVARPVQSNQEHTLFIKIWDKQGDGTFTAELPFIVMEDERIKVEKNIASCDKIYLFSIDKDQVITEGRVGFNEDIYFIFEGLSGFYEENGKVFAGLKLQVTDNARNIILANDDLLKSYEETGISKDDFNTQIYARIVFKEGEVVNPLLCEVIIFDKKSDASVKATTELYVK
jgi:hypothetical protein